MKIQQMFVDDINRKINGVVKVDQDEEKTLVQELDEYVITKELKKHFITFFNNYSETFDIPSDDIGVWISGFFGSGKSHFLKMLSYLLENKEVQGVKTVERFRKKFEDDPATFMLIDKATKGETDTILFNIDIEGSINKDKTAVLRVFAKMFYNHLGYYGENLKCAKLEQFIDRQGKTEEFRKVFEEKNGQSWLESRDAFAFFEDDVVDTLVEVLGMSETSAHNWFDGSEEVEMSIAQLVTEIKEYTDKKSKNYRLLFMVDEMGQYAGGDTDLLLNLQSLVEKIGSECGGKVWVICTGQEAIDEIIKARENEFSRIQARFVTRLSLSSSSADEVIQKRILKKKPEVKKELESVYETSESILRNLFSFTDALLDIKGYTSGNEFAKNFPFVPYQFIVMQKVFAEIRKHGNSGKHLSGGERSMLSGFQEAAQKIEDKDEYSLAPFYLFYDTVHTFLDSSIRRVIERCQKAADNKDGIEQQDVEVLKLLYLIRYVDDIPANLDNIVILMADDIRIDKINMRESVRGSLDRLFSQNYIGRVGDTYNFLTDEEQDIQKEINNTPVDTSEIVSRISQIVFGDIYTSKKFRKGIYDFPFDQKVDEITVGTVSGGMCLRVLTVATDPIVKSDSKLSMTSKGQAVVVLADTPYYETLERAMKIRKYVKQRNVTQLAKTTQDIVRAQQEQASKYEENVTDELRKAITGAVFFVDGEKIDIRSGEAKSKIDQALEYLVDHVYSDLSLVVDNAESDADVIAILNGTNSTVQEIDPNREAEAKIEEFLEMQNMKNLPTSMSDIQSRYQNIPYGWREVDIAAVVARLIMYQKVTIKYGGATIQPSNPKLVDMLRKKSEIGKTVISKRMIVSAINMKRTRDFLREYFDVMDVPDDEDGLVAFIVKKFEEQKAHYNELMTKYNYGSYPDKLLVKNSIELVDGVLSQQKDNNALIKAIIDKEDALFDNKDDMVNIEDFFKTQVSLFDKAVKFIVDMRNDLDYIKKDEEASKALGQMRLITTVQVGKPFDYGKIPELNHLMIDVNRSHNAMLDAKRNEIFAIISECIAKVHQAANGDAHVKNIIESSDKFYEAKKEQIRETNSLTILDGNITQLWDNCDKACQRIESALKPEPVKPAVDPIPEVNEKKGSDAYKTKTVENIRTVYRQALFQAKVLHNEDEVDKYLEIAKKQMMQNLNGFDGIKVQ